MDNHKCLIRDNHGRRVNYLRISVTDRCNFRCLYCRPPEGVPLLPREEILSYEEIIQVVKTAVRMGITKFRVTGGEPLVRSGVVDFLKTLVQTPGVQWVSLTTNGLLLQKYANQLIASGINSINISLNSLKADTFTKLSGGVDGLKDVRAGIDTLLKCGYKNIKINTVIMNDYNDDEILDLARLTINQPIALRFIEYMPCGNWQENSSGWTISARELISQIGTLGRLGPVSRQLGQGPARYYQLHGAKGIIGFITAVSQPFCATCNRLRLTADGQLKSCLLSTDTIDLRPIIHSDSQLSDAFIRAAMLKPAVHHNEELAVMSKIGG
ncbi:MAG: GTP 3',8-cyclase MoaA [Planctomycetota bacterium]|nr:GTP 3',8-cyclase MoaA [Planctomycetota bacterium]